MRFMVIDIAAKKLAARFVNEAEVNRGTWAVSGRGT
jgi:hypothetical protein